LKPAPLTVGHWPGSDRVSISIWKVNDNTKKVLTGGCLAQNVINRILAFSFCSLHKCPAEADFFHLVRRNNVPVNMCNAVVGPDDPSNLHLLIVTAGVIQTNAIIWNLFPPPTVYPLPAGTHPGRATAM
jgi:hypothetical protein